MSKPPCTGRWGTTIRFPFVIAHSDLLSPTFLHEVIVDAPVEGQAAGFINRDVISFDWLERAELSLRRVVGRWSTKLVSIILAFPKENLLLPIMVRFSTFSLRVLLINMCGKSNAPSRQFAMLATRWLLLCMFHLDGRTICGTTKQIVSVVCLKKNLPSLKEQLWYTAVSVCKVLFSTKLVWVVVVTRLLWVCQMEMLLGEDAPRILRTHYNLAQTVPLLWFLLMLIWSKA